MSPAAQAGDWRTPSPACAAPRSDRRPAGRRKSGGRKPSVIFVREWEQQMSGSGCCGRLGGDVLAANGAPIFAERRALMEGMGPLYRAIKQAFGDRVEVLVVDPRNQISLLPRLVRDAWRFHVGPAAALRTASAMSIPTVIVNARIFARGAWPEVDTMLSHLGRLVAQEGSGGVVV